MIWANCSPIILCRRITLWTQDDTCSLRSIPRNMKPTLASNEYESHACTNKKLSSEMYDAKLNYSNGSLHDDTYIIAAISLKMIHSTTKQFRLETFLPFETRKYVLFFWESKKNEAIVEMELSIVKKQAYTVKVYIRYRKRRQFTLQSKQSRKIQSVTALKWSMTSFCLWDREKKGFVSSMLWQSLMMKLKGNISFVNVIYETIYKSRETMKNLLLEESLKEQVVHLFRALRNIAEMCFSIVK